MNNFYLELSSTTWFVRISLLIIEIQVIKVCNNYKKREIRKEKTEKIENN